MSIYSQQISSSNVISEVKILFSACRELDLYVENSQKIRQFLLNEIKNIYELPACYRDKFKKYNTPHYKLSLRSSVLELKIYSSVTRLCSANLEVAANLIIQKIEQLENYSGKDCSESELRKEKEKAKYNRDSHIVSTGILNVYSGPSKNYSQIDSIYRGQGVKIDQLENSWAYIYYLPEGILPDRASQNDVLSGWVNRAYLSKIKR